MTIYLLLAFSQIFSVCSNFWLVFMLSTCQSNFCIEPWPEKFPHRCYSPSPNMKIWITSKCADTIFQQIRSQNNSCRWKMVAAFLKSDALIGSHNSRRGRKTKNVNEKKNHKRLRKKFSQRFIETENACYKVFSCLRNSANNWSRRNQIMREMTKNIQDFFKKFPILSFWWWASTIEVSQLRNILWKSHKCFYLPSFFQFNWEYDENKSFEF